MALCEVTGRKQRARGEQERVGRSSCKGSCWWNKVTVQYNISVYIWFGQIFPRTERSNNKIVFFRFFKTTVVSVACEK